MHMNTQDINKGWKLLDVINNLLVFHTNKSPYESIMYIRHTYNVIILLANCNL